MQHNCTYMIKHRYLIYVHTIYMSKDHALACIESINAEGGLAEIGLHGLPQY